MTEHLVKVAINDVEWETLYECPDTKALWVRMHPDSGLHGGGPWKLEKLCSSKNECAEIKTKWLSNPIIKLIDD